MRLIDADALYEAFERTPWFDNADRDIAEELANNAPTVSPWVKMSDRLPKPWVTVLLWDGYKMLSGYADDDGDLIDHRWGLVFRATHWMLPEPPGEEGEG